MTTRLEIDSAFDTIEDRLMADLTRAKERARSLGEIPHTVSLTAYFNNTVLGLDTRQLDTSGDADQSTPYVDAELISQINQVIDSRLAKRLPYFQPAHEELVTWGVLADMRYHLEQWVMRSYVEPHGRAIQDLDKRLYEMDRRLKDTRWGMVGLACALTIVLALIFSGAI